MSEGPRAGSIMALSDPILRRKRMSAVGGTATARVSMCGAAASCSIALNVCQILEIDLEKLLRGGNSILGRRRTVRATHPPGARQLSDACAGGGYCGTSRNAAIWSLLREHQTSRGPSQRDRRCNWGPCLQCGQRMRTLCWRGWRPSWSAA